MTTQAVPCPYCGDPLRWTAPVVGLRGEFGCKRCGDFIDYRSPVPASGRSADRKIDPHSPPDAGR
jgi:hypothetical protein